MKVYITTPNSLGYGGGLEQVVHNLVNNFSGKIRDDICVLTNDLNRVTGRYIFDGINCYNLPTKRFGFLDKVFLISQLLFSWRIYLFVKKNIKCGDIINIHGGEYAFFLSLFKGFIKTDFSYFLTIHGSFLRRIREYIFNLNGFSFFFIKFFFIFHQYYFWMVEYVSTKKAPSLIFTTNLTKDYYLNHYGGYIANKYYIISNGVDISQFQTFQSCKIGKNKLSGLIIGGSYHLKGLDIGINIAESLYSEGIDFRLNVIGFSGDDVKKHKHKNYINYIGRVAPSDMPRYFSESDFLLFPSRTESFGLVTLEAFLSGIPIIIGKNAAKIDIDYSRYGYLVDSYHYEDYIKPVKNMMIEKNYLHFVDNIKSTSWLEFDWKNIAKKYEDLFLDKKL